MNADHVQLNTKWDYKNVSSPFYRLYLIDAGEGKLSASTQQMRLEKDHLYLIPSYTAFNQSCPGFLSQYYIHIVEESPDGSSLFAQNRLLMRVKGNAADLACMQRIVALNPGRDLRKTDNPAVYEQSQVMTGFLDLNKQQPLAAAMETQGLILQLLSRFLSPGIFKLPHSSPVPKMEDAVNFIEANLAANLTVALLAGRANQSKDHFSKLFVRKTGRRPLDYIHHKRVERAQFLLVTTNLPLSVITEQTGFESLSYFSRIFKRITGQTPGEYKNSHDIII